MGISALGAGPVLAGVLSYGMQPLSGAKLSYEIKPLYVGAFAPPPAVPAGGVRDGVGLLRITVPGAGSFGCSGSLLTTGQFLTAAHCVTDGGAFVPGTTATVSFEDGPGDTKTVAVTSFTVNPDWDGDLFEGTDLAVLGLDTAVDISGVTHYELYRGADEIGQLTEKVGYGLTGTGTTGWTGGFGTKREGEQVYDAEHDLLLAAFGLVPGVDFVPGAVLQYDFDDGTSCYGPAKECHDAFGFFSPGLGLASPGLRDPGVGPTEVASAPGDSGGPTFIDGKIAGITSYGITIWYDDFSTSDVTPFVVDSSFGEFAGDTRVSSWADWIDSVTAPPAVPEPATLGLLGAGLLALGLRRRKA